jgi:hypothetical protein
MNLKRIIAFSLSVVILVTIITVVILILKINELSKLKTIAAKAGILLSSEQMSTEFGENAKSAIQEEKYNKALSLYVEPEKNDKWLPRIGLNYLPCLDKKSIEPFVKSLADFTNKNLPFIKEYEKIDELKDIRCVKNFNNPDYHKINSFCFQVFKISSLFYVKVENDIVLNSSSKVVKDIYEIARSDDMILNLPFIVSNDLYRANTFFLTERINRSINSLSLSDTQLRELIDILNKREKNILYNLNVVLKGAVYNFFTQMDSGLRLPVGVDIFWMEVGVDKKPTVIQSQSSLWVPFKMIREKTNMLRDVLEVKETLFNFNNFQKVKPLWEEFEIQRHKENDLFLSHYIDFKKLYLNNLISIAYLRTQATLLACILYKHKHNRYPENINELIEDKLIPPQSGIDPYNGNVFHIKYGNFNALIEVENRAVNSIPNYEKRNGIRVYSVGLNCIDQGGRGGNFCQDDTKNDDITAIYLDSPVQSKLINK